MSPQKVNVRSRPYGEITISGNFVYWTLDNFSESYNSKVRTMLSRYFSFVDKVWFLSLSPNEWFFDETKKWWSITLFSFNEEEEFHVRMGFLGENEQVITSNIAKFNEGAYEIKRMIRPSDFYMKMNHFLHCGNLKIFCEIHPLESALKDDSHSQSSTNVDVKAKEKYEGCDSSSAESTTQTDEELSIKAKEKSEGCDSSSAESTAQTEVKLSALTLCDEYKYMIYRGQACDATIKLGKCEFSVHSGILRTKSSFFAEILENTKNNEICVENCDAQVFLQLLWFMYSNKLKNPSPRILPDLYYASNMYSVLGLGKLCIDSMKSLLTEENVLDVIRIAKTHNESDLLEHAIHFFAENVDKMLLREEWKHYYKENVVEANLLLVDVLKYRPYKKVEISTNNFREMVYRKLVSLACNPNNH